jgi:uncharacterized membrane protein
MSFFTGIFWLFVGPIGIFGLAGLVIAAAFIIFAPLYHIALSIEKWEIQKEKSHEKT